ncbi:26S proteasome non-ATPase regulatory subunit 1-like protein A-like [Iris pallida]|uniref:26S proteasome non-ATPase regulatory subunit 1-like protein A-like n=1 Tax=Iris pallida TaxID=29817 RepID=A0AAX6I2X2_IRIPA|nr:26S proteasome non-ATPase regulatory subunit 1-like protein A-like [Iris pallida]KAJ6847913.1 26S proteasome non-ATPase regulatory subunit 1-like protein A-like [Iris pallida]
MLGAPESKDTFGMIVYPRMRSLNREDLLHWLFPRSFTTLMKLTTPCHMRLVPALCLMF